MTISHISLNVANIDETRDFYLAALKPLGYKVIWSLFDGKVLGLGRCHPDLWLTSLDPPSDERHEKSSAAGEGVETSQVEERKEKTGPMHIAFSACNRAQVRKFHEAAIAAGGKCNGPPGLRPEYSATYYGAFVMDPEGRNIEAVCMKPGCISEEWGLVGWSVAGLIAAGIGCGVAKWAGWHC